MNHALIRLREEVLALEEALATVDGDPSYAGGLGDANRLSVKMRAELAETREAISLLEEACVRKIAPPKPPVQRRPPVPVGDKWALRLEAWAPEGRVG